jgi:altered-inheritance-of-mitochondria protein 5
VERQSHHHDPLGFTSRKQVGVQQQKEDATVPPPEPPAHTRPGRITSALHRTRDTTLAMAHAMRDEAKEIVAEAKEVADEAVHEAKDAILAHRKAKSTSSSSDSSGGHNKKEIAKEKAHELAEKAKAAVHLVEEKAEAKLEARLTGVSEVEKALAERFDSARREEKLNKSVPETLAERYIPMDQGKGEKNKDWRLL